LSEENRPATRSGARTRRLAHDDLDIPPQPIYALQHLGFADSQKLTAQYAQRFELGNSENHSHLDLREIAMPDDLADLGSKGHLTPDSNSEDGFKKPSASVNGSPRHR
jgi:hypothetical protein